MKFLKIMLLSLAGLFVLALVGLFIFIKTFDLNGHLPEITAAATKTLGRPVEIDRADLNISLRGLVLDARGIKIADAAGAAPLFFAQNAHAQLALMPLLFKRQIEVSGLTASGIKANINDPKMPVHLDIPHVAVGLKGLSLTAPFSVTVDMAVASAKDNIHAAADVALNLNTSSIIIKNCDVTTDLALLDMAAVKAITPALAQAPLPVSVGGNIKAHVPQVVAGPKGMEGLNAHVEIIGGTAKFKELLTSLSNIHAQADIDLTNVNVTEASLNIGEGTVTASGTLNNYPTIAQLSAKAKVDGVKIEDLTDVNALPVVVKGKINGTASMTGQGLDPQVLLRSLKGEGDFNISGGVIEKFNILKVVLGSTLGAIPGLADSVDSLLTGAVKDKLGTDTVVLDKATAKFSIADQIVSLEDASVSTKAFDGSAKGTVGFDMATDIQVIVLVAQDLSADLGGKVEQLSYLYDENKRIKLTGKVSGTIPNVKFIPSIDVKRTTTNALIEEGTKQLQKVMEKNPEVGNILNGVLNGIFNKQQQ